MDKKMMIGLVAVIVVAIAVVAVLAISSSSDDKIEATPFGVHVYLDDGTDPCTKYSGTGKNVKEAIQDALSEHNVIFASNGNITSVDGLKNEGDRRWVVFNWASPRGWSPLTDTRGSMHEGASLAVRYSERVSDEQGNITYSSPDIQVKYKAYYFIRMDEKWDATTWMRELPLTESQKKEGFWISGEGTTNNEALADAVLKNFYPDSKVEIRKSNIVEYIVDGRGDDIEIPENGMGPLKMDIRKEGTLYLGFNAGDTDASLLVVRLVDAEGHEISLNGKAVTATSKTKPEDKKTGFEDRIIISSIGTGDEQRFGLEVKEEVNEWVEKKFPGLVGYGFEIYMTDEESNRKTGSVILTPSKDALMDLPFFKYGTKVDSYGWFLSFLGWSDTLKKGTTGTWTFWNQYSYNPEAKTNNDGVYWDFNPLSFGMYDISKYHYFAVVLRTSVEEGQTIVLPTPSEIPEGL